MSTTTTSRITKELKGIGDGPSIIELQEFVKSIPEHVIGRVTLKKTPRDRPFDPEGWSISANYQEGASNG